MTVINLPNRSDEDEEEEFRPQEPEEQPDDAGEPGPPPQIPYEGTPGRQAIFPWESFDALTDTLRFHAGRYQHATAYHGVRSGPYLVRTLWYSVRGVRVLGGKLIHWWHAPDLWLLESQAVARGGRDGHADAMRAHLEGKKTRGMRGKIIFLALLGVLGVLALLAKFMPPWGWLVLAAVTLVVLAHHGKPAGKALIGPAYVGLRYEKVTLEILTRGLAACDIKGINQHLKDGQKIDFLSDPYQAGEGWGCEANLPHGVTAGMVIARRDRLASGVRRPLSAVWPEPVPSEHEGRISIWIGFTDMSKQRQKPWPLLKAGQVNIFEPVPFATSPRGKTISEPLFQANWLIGAAPGEGKTNTVRVLGAAAALDPLCDLWVHELAGKSDLSALGRVAHRYVSGLDDASVLYALESLRMLAADLRRRSDLFKKIPIEQRPDGALTRNLAASDKRLRPKVAIFDEVQNLFMHPELGQEAAQLAAYIIRVGRAYGIIVILSTQRPGEKELPTAVRSLVTIRFCLKVADWQANDMILGTGAYSAGFNSVAFRHEIDAGLGWLKGTADPAPVRTFYLDLLKFQPIIERARALRVEAGVLGGYAADEEDDTEPRSFLADVLEIFHGDDKLWCETIALRLSAEMKDVYADITKEAVSDQLRALGAEVKQVRETGAGVRAGCWREAVEAAASGRFFGQRADE